MSSEIQVVLLAAIGLAVGSFLNVCIHRLPRGESLNHPPSRCPQCGTALRWFDNVPVLGWLVTLVLLAFAILRFVTQMQSKSESKPILIEEGEDEDGTEVRRQEQTRGEQLAALHLMSPAPDFAAAPERDLATV